ncbi:MAG: iron-containing alcohol dehydrogenase [Deltaproteobacteria bacterium]|nr:MAG: iron-containing alcohol dehydrogenase [Deltaproteobacteria bacterium]
MTGFEFCLPTRIVFGPGKLSRIGELAKPLGIKAALISDKPLTELGLVARVKQYLHERQIETVEFTEVTPNPLSTMINEVTSSMKGEKIDLVVGIGGGSPIDFAKAVAIALTHPGDIWNYIDVGGKSISYATGTVLPIIAVVTTSGTGSEVTPYSVLTNPKTSEKCGIVCDKVFPRISIVDPELTRSMPPKVTASTGVDALSHSVESYLNKDPHGYSEVAALQAIRLVSANLPTAVAAGKNLEDRSRMAWAATLAGIAISHANTTLVHAMGHPISGRFNVGHGEAMALGLPVMMRHSWMLNMEKFASIAEAMGVDTRRLSLKEAAKKSVEAMATLLEEVRLNLRLRDYGVKESDLKNLAKDATGYMIGCLESHPHKFSIEEVTEFYREML